MVRGNGKMGNVGGEEGDKEIIKEIVKEKSG